MKRAIPGLLILVLCAMPAGAADFSQDDLTGAWELFSYGGKLRASPAAALAGNGAVFVAQDTLATVQICDIDDTADCRNFSGSLSISTVFGYINGSFSCTGCAGGGDWSWSIKRGLMNSAKDQINLLYLVTDTGGQGMMILMKR